MGGTSQYDAHSLSRMDSSYPEICSALLDIDHDASVIMNKIQFAAIRTILSLFRTTLNNMVLHLVGEMPLDIRRELLAKRFACKILSRRSHCLHDILQEYNNYKSHNNIQIEAKFLELLISLNREYSNLLVKSKLPDPFEFPYFSRFVSANIDTQLGTKLQPYRSAESLWERYPSTERYAPPQRLVDDAFRTLFMRRI